MSISRRVARPLLASVFAVGGLDSVLSPEPKIAAAQKVTAPLAENLTVVPNDTGLLVQVNGAVQVAAAVLLSLGRFRRLSALLLIGSIVPTTYAGHRFWEETDDQTRKLQLMSFLKNLGLVGGLILEAMDTEGAPSLRWRARRRVEAMGGSERIIPEQALKAIPEQALKALHDIDLQRVRQTIGKATDLLPVV